MRVWRDAARAAGLAALGLCWVTAQASAHPHVFINTRPTLVFEDGRLVAITQDWTFDEVFSDQMFQEFGAGHKAKLGPEQVAALRAGAFDNLVNYTYFTHVRANDKELALTLVEDFTAEVRGKLLGYRFTARLPKPLDPRATAIRIGLYDPDYYVEVVVAAGATVQLDHAPPGCVAQKINDKAHPIYLGSVFPETIVLSCASS